MVVLGRGESLCTDVIDVDSGDADNDDEEGKCDDVEKAAVAPRPRPRPRVQSWQVRGHASRTATYEEH